jgi:DNA-binding XRE family transcriptional regulator
MRREDCGPFCGAGDFASCSKGGVSLLRSNAKTMSKSNGQWLRSWRLRNNYRQSELAEELAVSRQSVVKWEKLEAIDRVLQLALLALEMEPSLQNIGARGRPRRPE